MKIKLDQNLSIHLVELLAALNHDVDTVFDEGLSGVDDVAVMHPASSQNRILFTLDTDFLNLKAFSARYPQRHRCFSPAASRDAGFDEIREGICAK
jgi:predicted nuclease of predicted toxin-antitoxin system